MDVVGLAFTVFGHLLASVLYIWRRIPFSPSNEAVDRSSILENRDQLRQLWEKRIMADEQSQGAHESQVSSTEEMEANEDHTKKVIVENGTPTASKLAEESEKETHDSDAVDRNMSNGRDDLDSTPIEAQTLTEESGQPTETNPTNHLDESSDGKPGKENDSKEEKVPEINGNTSNSEESSLSDDQKAANDREKSEIAESDADKPEILNEVDRMEENVLGKTPNEQFTDCSAKAKQVTDDTEEPLEEPNTEAYYTSSFTFVCQKSHEEEEEEQTTEELYNDAEEKMEGGEIPEDGEENPDASETPEPIKASSCDDNADISPVSGEDEIPESSSFSDAPLSECLRSTEEAVTDEVCGSELSYECTLTGEFHETNDEAGNTSESQIVDEKNENEPEIDVETYSEIKTSSAGEDRMNQTGSAVSDSNGELKAGKIERPGHFVRLKPTGVQKTERPYDSGTTESKIAMEIREMREREEELRQMRERMQSPEANNSASSSPLLSPTTSSKQKSLPPQGNNNVSSEPGPGYRVSTVFGHKGSPVQSPVEEEKKMYRCFSKESAVEKEIRIARNREEELRKEKGLPPREDDSYIKPSQVKSAQVRVFGKVNASNSSKELATTKIQQEIEEQTLREMALREKGHIQTISQERTDSKVAKLKDLDVSVPECVSPAPSNGHVSPLSDRSSKRSTPSPTGSSHGSIPPVSPRPVVSQGKGISMQKFIASKGKETTFIASRNGPSHPEQNADASRSNPVMRKAKRTVSVESKIQQEILEMKLREEELKRMHNSSVDQSLLTTGENGTDHGEETNDVPEYTNGQEINGNDDSGPSSNNLIAQWEQRIQKAEGRA